MDAVITKNPEYIKHPVPEFQGHPLIEALRPMPMDDEEIFRRLVKIPQFDEEEELALPPIARSLLPDRLYHFMYPMAQHIRIYKSIYAQVIGGYRYRNPLTPEGQDLLHSDLDRTSTISFGTGISGIGKSSLVKAIAGSLGGPVICHTSYCGQPLTEKQFVYLKVNAPDQCSPKALCTIIGQLIDSKLGTDHAPRLFSERKNRTAHVSALRKMLKTYHVGVLIIDAFENISLARAGGREELAALLGNMRDEGLGVPILLVGTYRAAEILDENLSTARRFSEGGYFELRKPSSPAEEDWGEFCEILWPYQWVRKRTKLTEEIRDVLFDCSQGITGILLTLFIKAQKAAIDLGRETVDAKLLRAVYREQLQPIHGMINALRSGEKSALSRYEDIYRKSSAALEQKDTSNRLQEVENLIAQSGKPIVPITNSKSNKKPANRKRSVAELKKMVVG